MTREQAREIARAQNDRDHAAGKLPSRYIEDTAVLGLVLRLLDAAPRQPSGPADQGRGTHGRA